VGYGGTILIPCSQHGDLNIYYKGKIASVLMYSSIDTSRGVEIKLYVLSTSA
jgi:hypothetical protein